MRAPFLTVGLVLAAASAVPVPAAPAAPGRAAESPPPAPFHDITAEAGIRFVHHDGATGEKLLPETMGGGVAWLDYDRDGDPDLLFVDSGDWPAEDGAGAAEGGAGRSEPPPLLVLYANDGSGKFRDITRETGLDLPTGAGSYGQGVAVGDYDGDGWLDLYVTAVGPNHLLRNCAGRFEDVTAAAGVGGGETWSTGAAFFDADGDGDLDLFVGNYLDWSPETDRTPERRRRRTVRFAGGGEGLTYGLPQSYRGAHPFLFLNRGDGTFAEVAEAAGLQVSLPATGEPLAKAMAVAPVDLDGDGRTDLLVSNDTTRNLLFHNLGSQGGHGGSGGTPPRFEEVGELYGLAYDADGHTTGAMGVDWGYLDGGGDLAFLVGNFAGEATSLYRAQRDPTFFADESLAAGLAAATRAPLAFGLLLLDYDLDGRLDVLQANGHVESDIERIDRAQRHAQPPQLFWNAGTPRRGSSGGSSQHLLPRLVPLPAGQTGDLARPLVGRGAAYADLDGDGDLDVVLTQPGGPPRLLRNDQQSGHHWLRLRLEGRPPNRQALGAALELTAGGAVQRREVAPSRGYLSQVELPVTFGLGESRAVERLKVTWPGGHVETFPVPAVDRLQILVQGRGEPGGGSDVIQEATNPAVRRPALRGDPPP